MTLVSHSDVKKARQVIDGRVYRTPMVRSAHLSKRLGLDIYLKLEQMQKTGSFKVRGAINRIAALTDDEKIGTIAR